MTSCMRKIIVEEISICPLEYTQPYQNEHQKTKPKLPCQQITKIKILKSDFNAYISSVSIKRKKNPKVVAFARLA